MVNLRLLLEYAEWGHKNNIRNIIDALNNYGGQSLMIQLFHNSGAC